MDELALLASAHDGVFTTRQAAAVGLGRDALISAVRGGVVRRLARGVYAVGDQPRRPEDRHAELCRGLRLQYPDGVLAGRSAVVAHGLPTWNVPLATALLLRPVTSQVRRSGAVVRSRPDGPVVGTPLGPATIPATSLVQVALDHGTAAGVVSADAALHRDLVTPQQLEAELTARAGHPRIQYGMAMARFADGRAESPGESRLRLTLTTGGFTLDPQFVVRDPGGGFVGRADLRIRGSRVLVEFDGAVKYSDGGPEALVAEKWREDRIRALGWVVVRVCWLDLERPRELLVRIHRAVAQAALLPTLAG